MVIRQDISHCRPLPGCGKYADIIAVRGDPLTNVSLLEDVSFVMKAGTIYKTP
jgi:imidazolonepropionase-like amidohydrolase|tara:strand:+ start:3041 stop:3199 length:159 start_codon:yes stop_codon:yes gene_type:complete